MSITESFSLELPNPLSPEEAARVRKEWVDTLHRLMQQIKEWVADEPGWKVTEEHEKEVSEYQLGIYSMPVLTFQTPHAEVVVEPVARNVGGKGAVGMFVLPTLRRVKLLHSVAGVEWQVLTDSGISLRDPWEHKTFTWVINQMINVDL